jgi:hypothetical protein
LDPESLLSLRARILATESANVQEESAWPLTKASKIALQVEKGETAVKSSCFLLVQLYSYMWKQAGDGRPMLAWSRLSLLEAKITKTRKKLA